MFLPVPPPWKQGPARGCAGRAAGPPHVGVNEIRTDGPPAPRCRTGLTPLGLIPLQENNVDNSS